MSVMYDVPRYWKYELEFKIKSSKFYNKNTGLLRVVSVNSRWFSIGLQCTFLESMGII